MNVESSTAQLHTWLTRPMPRPVAESIARLCRMGDVRHVAVMPDVHLANEVCVGVALATRQQIYPAAVGRDIGCGMAAIGFEADADLLGDERSAARVLDGLYRRIPALKLSRAAVAAALPTELRLSELSDPRLESLKQRDGRYQLGTLGRGNHFVELQADEQNRLWLMVHSGSRGMGQAISDHHLRLARNAGKHSGLLALDAESPSGRAYLADLAWAVAYAEQNRLAMVAAVAQLLRELFGISELPDSLIHANHNHVRREMHFDQALWVHRKGALAAANGQPGVIPGSMGSASFHVLGRGDTASLCSSSHGAGRELSRRDAAQKIPARRLLRELRGVWFDHRQAALLRDEAPSAYKDIHAVMRAQRDLTKITRQLRPLLCYKGV